MLLLPPLLLLLLLLLLGARGRFWTLHGLDTASAGVEQHVWGARCLLSAPVVVTHSNASACICDRDCAAGAGIVGLVSGALRQPHRRLFGQRVGIQPEQLLQIIGCLTNRTLLLLLQWRRLHQLLRLTVPP